MRASPSKIKAKLGTAFIEPARGFALDIAIRKAVPKSGHRKAPC